MNKMEGSKISKLKKGISLIVLVIALAGMMTAFVTVHGATTFQGYVKDISNNPISGAVLVLADCYFNILASSTTNS